ncbi:hypothetical protein RCO28_23325 [Streptomyces sp. LHD-70]|uniref:hypothetical protein n=1 Tax=Streptomyces sp. LHD-70 TaxID=3072140 RepID=UPI00280E8495|nr:hypothetical protein [Streptomyces sp. LHD-70]MDQ8705405.1 hypothetical protein [Streptomyces sp. LHD-70]
MKQAFEQIPVEVEEAAKIDGANVLRTWASVVLPMVRPALGLKRADHARPGIPRGPPFLQHGGPLSARYSGHEGRASW